MGVQLSCGGFLSVIWHLQATCLYYVLLQSLANHDLCFEYQGPLLEEPVVPSMHFFHVCKHSSDKAVPLPLKCHSKACGWQVPLNSRASQHTEHSPGTAGALDGLGRRHRVTETARVSVQGFISLGFTFVFKRGSLVDLQIVLLLA